VPTRPRRSLCKLTYALASAHLNPEGSLSSSVPYLYSSGLMAIYGPFRKLFGRVPSSFTTMRLQYQELHGIDAATSRAVRHMLDDDMSRPLPARRSATSSTQGAPAASSPPAPVSGQGSSASSLPVAPVMLDSGASHHSTTDASYQSYCSADCYYEVMRADMVSEAEAFDMAHGTEMDALLEMDAADHMLDSGYREVDRYGIEIPSQHAPPTASAPLPSDAPAPAPFPSGLPSGLVEIDRYGIEIPARCGRTPPPPMD